MPSRFLIFFTINMHKKTEKPSRLVFIDVPFLHFLRSVPSLSIENSFYILWGLVQEYYNVDHVKMKKIVNSKLSLLRNRNRMISKYYYGKSFLKSIANLFILIRKHMCNCLVEMQKNYNLHLSKRNLFLRNSEMMIVVLTRHFALIFRAWFHSTIYWILQWIIFVYFSIHDQDFSKYLYDSWNF